MRVAAVQYRGNNTVRYLSAPFVIGTQIDMRSTFRVLASLAALSAAACVASSSLAQEAAPPAAPPSAAAHQHWAEHMQARAEAHAKALHDILNIQPSQEAAFQTFLAAMKPEHEEGMGEHREMHDMHDMHDMAQLTTPQRLDRIAAEMAARQAEFQRHADAVKAFYAALDPQQQRAFDALPPMMGHGMHGHHHGPGGFKGHPGQG
jgi:hypothetical protein